MDTEIKDTVPLKQIYWHKGQFLQPQHFQHTDLFHQSRMNTLIRTVSAYFEGVVFLEINEKSLSNDVFEVLNGEFIMPDGTYVDFPDDAVMPSRSVTSAWKDRNKPFKVYVGISKMKQKDENVTIVSGADSQNDIKTRYLVDAKADEIGDYFQGGSSVPIKQLTYSLRLFWETEVEDVVDYDLVEIAEIISDGGVAKLSPTFIPACLHIASSPVLMKTLKEVRDELAGRIRQLEDYKMPVGSGNTHVDGRTLGYRQAIQLLSQYVPLLFHYIDTPKIHPFDVYGVLRQLIGGISTLSTKINFLGENEKGEPLLPAYDHDDLGECFQSAYKLIVQLMNELTVSSETIVRLEKGTDGSFRAELDANLLDAGSIYISLITVEDIDDIIEPFLGQAKVGSIEGVKILIERSLPGLKLDYQKALPEGVPRRLNASYFKVDRRDPAWEFVVQQRNIMMIWDEAPIDLKVDFISV